MNALTGLRQCSQTILRRQCIATCTLRYYNDKSSNHTRRPARYVRDRFDRNVKHPQSSHLLPAHIQPQSKYDKYIKHVDNKTVSYHHKPKQSSKVQSHGVTIQGELLYGRHAVKCALYAQQRQCYTLYVQNNIEQDAADIIQLAQKHRNIEIQYVTRNQLSILTNNALHNGIVLDCTPLHVHTINDAKQLIQQSNNKSQTYIMLHELHDAMNIGAVLRSCHYFGVDTVILSNYKSAKLTPLISKASSGAMELLNIVYCKSTTDLLHDIHNNHTDQFNIVGMTLSDNAIDCHKFATDNNKSTIIIVGNEGAGLHNRIVDLCNQVVQISCRQSKPTESCLIDSLNVSNAAAIMLYQITQSIK